MRAARNAAEAKMQTKNKTRRGGSKSSRRAAYLMNKMIPAKRFAKRFFREFFTPSASLLGHRLARGRELPLSEANLRK